MKEITIDGKKFQYEISYKEEGESGGVWTDFYYGTKKKDMWYGGTKLVPRFAFRVYSDIEDIGQTKEDTREKVMEAYDAYVIEWAKLIKRGEELIRGEII